MRLSLTSIIVYLFDRIRNGTAANGSWINTKAESPIFAEKFGYTRKEDAHGAFMALLSSTKIPLQTRVHLQTITRLGNETEARSFGRRYQYYTK